MPRVFITGLGFVTSIGNDAFNGCAGLTKLTVPNSVAVDQTYFERLGISGLGATAEIRGQKVEVTAVTKGIRSFTTTPSVFTTLDRARAYTGVSPNKATYFLIKVAPGMPVISCSYESSEKTPTRGHWWQTASNCPATNGQEMSSHCLRELESSRP